MSRRVLEILSEARLHYIPSGRQLPRTPPLTSVKRKLDFCNEDSHEELQRSAGADGTDQDDDNQNKMLDFNTLEIKSEPDDPSAMLRGMTGYQLTQTDSEFMETMTEEKLVKKLQGELEELQRLFTKEMALSELALVSRKKAQAGLQTLPSCDDLTEWVKAVLKMTSTSTDVTDLDAKSLLAMVTRKDIESVTDEKRMELSRMKKMVANKRKKEAHAKGQLEKQVASEQLEIQGSMSQLSDLKSELSQLEEVYKALEMQLNTQEAPEIPAERQEKRGVKGRAKALGATEPLQDAKEQGKSTRSKLEDSRPGVKDDQEKALKTKPKSGAADQKEKRAGGQKAEAKESNSQESNPQESGRGRRKPPGPAAPQGKHQSPADAGEALSSSLQSRKRAAGEEEEEAQTPVLRRSKRIASRR